MGRSPIEAPGRLMSFPIFIEPEAEEDLASAYHWYEGKHPDLGRDFLQCVEVVLQRIAAYPEAHAKVYKSIRQTLVRRFPYVVCYTFHDECVHVIAVFHGHRDPQTWKSR